MHAAPNVVRSPVAASLEPPGQLSRLGLIALATDLTTEREAARLLPTDSVALHVTRVDYDNPTTPTNLASMAPRLSAAAALILPGVDLRAIYYACSAASALLGDDGVAAAILAAKPGVPVVSPPAAAIEAFHALNVGRIAVVTPYLRETTTLMTNYFGAHGLDVVTTHYLGLDDDREMARLTATTIIDAAMAADIPDAEAIFISCTALPVLGLVDTLEARLNKPVVTANQAGLWRLLAHAGSPTSPGNWGMLFARAPAEAMA